MLKYEGNRTKEIINTVRYYDASNFARGLKAPVFYAFGYNDITIRATKAFVFSFINFARVRAKQTNISQVQMPPCIIDSICLSFRLVLGENRVQ